MQPSQKMQPKVQPNAKSVGRQQICGCIFLF